MIDNNKLGQCCFIIQARLNSSRLPCKVLLYYKGTTVLDYLVKRLIMGGVQKERIIVAIPNTQMDIVLEEYIKNELKIRVVKGPENNVLKRYMIAAENLDCDSIVRLTADNPEVDMELINHCIDKHYCNNKNDITSTRTIDNQKITRFVPKGYSVDILNIESLLSINEDVLDDYDKEHVIPPFYKMANVQIVDDYFVSDKDASIDNIIDYTSMIINK